MLSINKLPLVISRKYMDVVIRTSAFLRAFSVNHKQQWIFGFSFLNDKIKCDATLLYISKIPWVFKEQEVLVLPALCKSLNLSGYFPHLKNGIKPLSLVHKDIVKIKWDDAYGKYFINYKLDKCYTKYHSQYL